LYLKIAEILIECGKDVELSIKNKEEFVDLYMKYIKIDKISDEEVNKMIEGLNN
jgi:hypothetical protein